MKKTPKVKTSKAEEKVFNHIESEIDYYRKIIKINDQRCEVLKQIADSYCQKQINFDKFDENFSIIKKIKHSLKNAEGRLQNFKKNFSMEKAHEMQNAFKNFCEKYSNNIQIIEQVIVNATKEEYDKLQLLSKNMGCLYMPNGQPQGQLYLYSSLNTEIKNLRICVNNFKSSRSKTISDYCDLHQKILILNGKLIRFIELNAKAKNEVQITNQCNSSCENYSTQKIKKT